MKTTFAICYILFFIITQASGQLNTSFGHNFSGNNFRIGYQYYSKEKTSLIAGIKIHVNHGMEKYINATSYRNKFRAMNTFEHFGIFHTIKRNLKYGNGNYRIYFLHDFTMNYLSKRMVKYQRSNFYRDTFGFNLYQHIQYTQPPFLSFENNFGLGMDLKMTNKVKVFLELGTGFIFFHHKSWDIKQPNGSILTLQGGLQMVIFTPHTRVGLNFNLFNKQ